MNWVEIVWPLAASVSLVFGLVHLLIWSVRRGDYAHLALAMAAFSLTILAVLERMALFNPSTLQTAAIIRWMHVPVLVLIVSLVLAVHGVFGFGSLWLAGSVLATRMLAVLLNFTTGVNLNFLRIDDIQWTTWWGVAVAHPLGPPNPALLVAVLSNVLLMIYLLQTLVRGLRLQPQRYQSLLVICGACLLLTSLLIAASTGWALQQPRVPLTLPAALILLLAVGWQLGGDLMRWNRLESLLRQSEVRRVGTERELDQAALTSGIGLWRWDVTGHRFVQNANNQLLLGTGTASLSGDSAPHELASRATDDVATELFAGVEPRERDALRRQFDAAIRASTYEMEYAVRDARGTSHWVCLRGSVEHDAQGAPVLVRGLTFDISRRRGEEARLQAVLDSSPTALLLIDEQGRIVYANVQACDLFGYGRDDMSGISVDTLLSPLGRGGLLQADERSGHAPSRRLVAGERDVVARRRCGNEFPVEVALSPLPLQQPGYIVAAISDLSERRNLEQELAIERESMAHMSRVAMIGEISGSLAHELNQPLAAILSNAQAAQRILRRDPTELADIREILDDIVDNDRRAGEVISRLRGLLKKEHRVFAPLSINELVEDSLRVIRNDLISRGVEYRMDLPANIPQVKGDHVQLQQVLLNLIINACDAMTAKAPRVLTVRSSLAHNRHIQVEVRDTGPGIADDMLEKVFAPFQSSKPNGMGMGLAICRTIIRAHGGRIWAVNAANGGARVCFELPQVE